MKSLEAAFGPNAALVEELYKQYQTNPDSIPPYWRSYFDELEGVSRPAEAPQKTPQAEPTKAAAAPQTKAATAAAQKSASAALPQGVQTKKILGVAAKIAENMDQSLSIPTATSLRVVPVKMMIEDREIINRNQLENGRYKTTFTHFIAWAIVKALKDFPTLNHSYRAEEGAIYRVMPEQVNLGVAIDLEDKKTGNRRLVVPNIKAADTMNFAEFLDAFYALIFKARDGKLDLADYEGTTISITNPGMIGTVSSTPRLMEGQGSIIATGAIDYPAEYQSMSQEVLNHLGISKVMTVSSTYDHRIIQGAESGGFLKRVHELLNGADGFYKEIFRDLGISSEPIPYGKDNYTGFLDGKSSTMEQNKKTTAVMNLINHFRRRGHILADVNPLDRAPKSSPELELEQYGLSMWDLDREFYCGGLGGHDKATLREIVGLLRETYCGHIGAEYMHILEHEELHWLREKMESTANKEQYTDDERKAILHKLNQAMAFELYLHKKFIGHKRFSLEGADTVIPMLHFLLEDGGKHALEKAYIGMAHRGRLNVLVNTLNKPYRKVFAEFGGNIDPDSIQGSGDVKYHLGEKGEHRCQNGHTIQLELLPNPSHLEAVNPVVEGATRAEIDHSGLEDPEKKFLPILIHGDAAFAGQGVVAETLNMSQLRGYKTGGTIHLIINNQIGFTTLPEDGRSTEYASDLAKTILAPIFHVNGDEPEAAVHAIRMALEYRQKFGKDVVIDLICYRQHGHNEGDEPGFTQPGMYKFIHNHKKVRDLYIENLLRKKQITQADVDEIINDFEQLLEQAFEDAKNAKPLEVTERLIDRSETRQIDLPKYPDTTFDVDELKEIAVKLNTVPQDFDANPKLLRILAKRAEIAEKNQPKIEWGYAEALAFGGLVKDGYTVRITGQDVERGTFSHRHSVLHGTGTNQQFVPLSTISEDQGKFYAYNSHLSEFAVLGFEFGYAATNDTSLVIWEAQFGDFANGAQVIIDQFISSSETKWRQKSDVVLNLPHGYEGQGPEHSSARLERFLQLCAEDNMQVVNLTTPAQYYHVLRKQALQNKDFKKPLIIMTPKSLLRHPKAVNSIEELATGKFMPFIPDTEIEDSSTVERVVFCTGKVYYDLLAQREEQGNQQRVAIVRLEQMYPYPDADILECLAEYAEAKDIVWCQEEPKNMGAWTFVAPRLAEALEAGQKLRYAGRQASASPAAGQMKVHLAEQERLVKDAINF